MINRYILFCSITFLLVLILLSASNVSAQPGCYGTTNYLIRDEAGKAMTLKELEKVTVSINGVPMKLRYDISGKEPTFYEYEFVHYYENKIIRDTGKIPFKNPLSISIQPYGFCGKTGDLTLTYRGKRMRLIFDIDEARHAMIDSLPFQSGTFYLNSAMEWEDMSKDWKRRLVWNDLWVTGIKQNQNRRCDETITVINKQKDWAAVWELFQNELQAFTINGSKLERQLLPAVDFKTEIVLVIYQRNTAERPRLDSFIVDKNGDLTFHPPPLAKPWLNNFCSLLLVAIYRSGVNSIEGKQLPPSDIKN